MSATPGEQNHKQPDIRVVEMLVCPLTKTQLFWNEKRDALVSRAAGVAFPIKNGVPLLCLDEARTLSQTELERLESGKSL